MLKRQRPTTPPPISAESSLHPKFEFTSTDVEQIAQKAKRRRVFAPALDGRIRGTWDDSIDLECEGSEGSGGTQSEHGEAEDDDDQKWLNQGGVYKQTNTLLHQLHCEQQLRATRCVHPQASTSKPFSPATSASVMRSPIPAAMHNAVQPESARVRPAIASHGPWNPHQDISLHGDTAELEEFNQVKARYEGHNRLLGSVVLSRMRNYKHSSYDSSS